MPSPFDKLNDRPSDEPTKPKPKNKDIKISKEVSRYQDISPTDSIESVRRVVKEVGKETSPLRITISENSSLEDIVYSMRKRNIKTDKTQIVRIGLNYILSDYEQNGDDSILFEVLQRLKA